MSFIFFSILLLFDTLKWLFRIWKEMKGSASCCRYFPSGNEAGVPLTLGFRDWVEWVEDRKTRL